MNREDYERFYHKGGTIIMPIETFNELFDEYELYKKDNEILKQALNDIREYCEFDKQNHGHVYYCGGKTEGIKIACNDILQIIDKYFNERIDD